MPEASSGCPRADAGSLSPGNVQCVASLRNAIIDLWVWAPRDLNPHGFGNSSLHRHRVLQSPVRDEVPEGGSPNCRTSDS